MKNRPSWNFKKFNPLKSERKIYKETKNFTTAISKFSAILNFSNLLIFCNLKKNCFHQISLIFKNARILIALHNRNVLRCDYFFKKIEIINLCNSGYNKVLSSLTLGQVILP